LYRWAFSQAPFGGLSEEEALVLLREENARLREALKALEPPRRRPWWRFWGS